MGKERMRMMKDVKDIILLILLVMFVGLFWNFDDPEGVDYKYDLFDIFYMKMIDE